MQDLSLHLMDICQNSIAAGASKISVTICSDTPAGTLIMAVEDNGAGMEKDFAERVTDPFTTTRKVRRVGLGLPLLKDSAQMAGGSLDVTSTPGKGTRVAASFASDHIDRLPLGDIGETLSAIILAYPGLEYDVRLDSKNGSFFFETSEVKRQLGGVPVNQYEVITWIREYINEGIKKIFGGVLNEIPG